MRLSGVSFDTRKYYTVVVLNIKIKLINEC